ncbi:NAD(P)/FAD-dependent oxidoreductase [Rhodococcus sp. BP-252]|uniref:NADH:ubiquinone reductase (non-electrogenic) n=1 Tax=Rhodococcoides kyotonense TaxID=398843 RepID=A0A177Y6N8_9NOCA|nr:MULTISPECIES: NAD(P)/FAD-dependent oxidoreductase [Rhodococcus]MBY6410369.1 NAD(P)/FAD-dependent oxidoreductase [Rhodococcus sp. BP-320]MBY6416251.1 NAD(P)/FAD-dependent oxidoreductase [Rhodococcus sp. BP-321]MBY6420246.1 NAD(P)/FAD-dependent oxidoreductase [Rhodococcus sp. BP-324]MBY6424925.1 NAD(P)/FAD-dependent oxidoreductase [Rhodococcus sp. BP-323]MBY6430369.1 NAD(P)/FAD-dependent oxidoreductase [Rhodococcus sp. BP-322]
MTAPGRPHVLVIGGGFGGLYAAKRLRHSDVAVTVLERGTSHVFQPLLYQCATGLVSEGSIASPLRHLLRHQDNAHVALGEASAIDAEARIVTASRFDGSTYELKYDFLVVAAGMQQAYHGHEEYIQYAPGMKTLDDALTIRRKLIAAFEMAESLPTAEERQPWLTFAVAGGGPTGVELAGQIRELATRALSHEFRSIDPREARVLLFHGDDRVLPSFDRKLSAAAQKTLDIVGVETHLGVHVTDVTETDVETTTKAEPKTKTRYDARTVLWTAGVEAVPFARTLATALGVDPDRSGRISVGPDLSVPGHPNVWVVGDMMAKDDLPGVAEVAMQGGRHVGSVIAAELEHPGNARAPFKYRDLGSAAYIARGHALVQAGPLRMSGFLGWLSWGFIHIAFLSGARNRVGTLVNWAATLATNSRRERAITYGDPETARKPYS